VSGVAIDDWRVTGTDLVWMVDDDNLGLDHSSFLGWLVVLVGGDVSSLDVLDGNVSDVESDVVTWNSFVENFVMHLDLLTFGGLSTWGEVDHHTWLDDTGFDSTDWDGTDT